MPRLPRFAAVLLVAAGAAHAAASPSDPEPLRAYAGVYAFGPHRDLAVVLQRAGGKAFLLLADTQTDALRLLFPDGEDAFVFGTEVARPSPAEARVRFERDAGGRVVRLQLRREGSTDVARAERQALRTRALRFKRAGLTFEGTLYLPEGGGGRAHPGVVMAHGSEDNDRDSFGPVPWVLARHGYAVLAYDKRGTGRTGGSWKDAGVEELAGDLAAAVEALAARPEVDARRVGVVAFSEGGWVAPLAAASTRRLAFILAVSGGGRTKGEAYVHKERVRAEARGLPPEQVRAAVVAAEQTVAESAARVRAGASSSGFDRRVTFDPAPHWRAFRGPVLCLAGEQDVLEDGPAAARWLGALFAEARHPDATVKLLPRAHHSLLLAREGGPAEFESLGGLTQLVPGYWSLLLDWLEHRAPPGPH